ncbi:MAG: hypothetical protein FWE25_03255 [Lachnospiraceae bacterium]|nr:hypothetical protein [Lachnospiraceae bacterium]
MDIEECEECGTIHEVMPFSIKRETFWEIFFLCLDCADKKGFLDREEDCFEEL